MSELILELETSEGEDAILARCPFCGGEGVVERTPAGAGHADDLAEFEPCSRCETVRRLADIMRRSRT